MKGDIRFMKFFASLPDVDLHLKSTDSVGMTPLHWAATEGFIPTVALLLNDLESADNNTTSISKDTASSSSSSSSSSLMIESSDSRVGGKKKDAVINVRDNSGCTPLLIAAQYGHADLAAFLIRKGANPNAVDDARDTALHWAAYKGSVPVCGLLMHLNGVDAQLTTKDTFGQTPLHLASLRGNTDVVRYLLEQAETSTYQQSSKMTATSTDSTCRVGSRSLPSSSVSQLDGLSNIGSSSSSSNLPKTLLTMSDRDGKTPLDLAIKKKRVAVEIILKNYMDKYCNDSSTSIRYVLKKCCSLSNWKVWFGLAQGSLEIQPPKAIFWFVIFSQLLGTVFIEFYLFMPIFSRSSVEEGRLWDCTILNCFRFTLSILMWLSFILCHETDPGTLSNSSMETKRQLTYYINDNVAIKRKMETLTMELRRLYDQTLDSYADANNIKNQPGRLSLCHTCHIAKPLRSKHCKVSNKCVLLFDHNCPFLGTTIGLYNYRYFFSYIVTMSLLLVHFIITWVTYVRRGDKIQWGWLALFVYLSMFSLMVGGLLAYHTQLIYKNLSTNEHQNIWRYVYLRDEYGRYFNPFNRGFFGNFYMRLFPGPDAYILPGWYSVSDSFPVNNKDSGKKEKSDSEAEEKQKLIEMFA